ncbi:MAG: S41 family peptidase [Peptococcaceae bacterium]|jgi:carboxyl-terminal processing protease|nr:S41 family peptidase [Peptococcaceae bacterium]
MNKLTKLMRARLSRLSLVMLLTGLLLLSNLGVVLAEEDRVTQQVRELIRSDYYLPVSENDLAGKSIDEMLTFLADPHSQLFTYDEANHFIGQINNTYVGIGVSVNMMAQGLYLNTVFPDTPAEEAGLRAGDIILSADGLNLAGMSQEEAISYIRGEPGTVVRLNILRGSERWEVSVPRREFTTPSIDAALLNGHIGYVKLYTFAEDAAIQFAQAVEELQTQQADSWIIDLCDNPGGYTDAARDMAGYFIGKNPVAHEQYQAYAVDLAKPTASPWHFTQPVIVLVNQNSASSSELLAAALYDYSKATLIGQTTYGKGVGQTLYDLADGSVLKLTIFEYFSPAGRQIQGVGVTPDLEISPDDQYDELDIAIWLLEQDIEAQASKEDTIHFMIGDHPFAIPAGESFDAQDWQIWDQLLASVPVTALQRENKETQVWEGVDRFELQKRWPLYFPGYQEIGSSAIPAQPGFIVRLGQDPVDWSTVNDEHIELINRATGERNALRFQAVDDETVLITTQTSLRLGNEYWLVIHPGIQETDGGDAGLQNALIRAVPTR